ncbi:hypothetical protein WCP94_001599 [Bilophila wadsworthia]
MIFPEKSAEGELARGGLRRAPKDKVQDDDSRGEAIRRGCRIYL